MEVGLNLGYSGAAGEVVALVEHAERVGFDSVWAAEAYGSDAVTVLAFLAARTEHVKLGSAVLQIPARTPAMTAMTAMTLDALSGGRFVLGLGVSGPQVVEGWHGVAYGKPLARTREYVDIVRAAIARGGRLTHDGEHYQIPYHGPGATGLGKPLKSILHPVRERVPIYLAAMGPRNVRLAGEVADGWLPLFYSPEREDLLAAHLDEGRSAADPRAGEKPAAEDSRARDVRIAATVHVAAGDDVGACRDRLRPLFALYAGGMGSRDRNFYAQLLARYGFTDAVTRIQEAFLGGRKADAAGAVPDEMIDEMALVGPIARIVERLEAWKASRVDELLLSTHQPDVLEPVREAL